MASRTNIVTSRSPEPGVSDDESVVRQLLSESQPQPSRPEHPPEATRPPHSFKTSVVKSANLLNAARVKKRATIPAPTVPSSPPSESSRTRSTQSSLGQGMAKAVPKKGKLKRPTFLSEDLAKPSQTGYVKRRDPYEIPVSPEKKNQASSSRLRETVNRKPLKTRKKGKGPNAKIFSSELSPEPPPSDVPEPAEEAPEPQKTSSPPPLLPAPHPSIFNEALLPNGKLRCTGTITHGVNAGAPCSHEGRVETEDGWRCNNHVSAHTDAHIDETSRRKSGRLTGEGVDISDMDWNKTPGFRYNSTRHSKRKAEVPQLESGKAKKSPRRQGAEPPQMDEADANTTNERRTRSQVKRTNPQVIVPANTLSKQAGMAKAGAAKAAMRTQQAHPEIEAGALPEVIVTEEVEEDAPTTAGHQEKPPVEGSEHQLTRKERSSTKGAETTSSRFFTGDTPALRLDTDMIEDRNPDSIFVAESIPTNPPPRQTRSKAAKTNEGALAVRPKHSRPVATPEEAPEQVQPLQREDGKDRVPEHGDNAKVDADIVASGDGEYDTQGNGETEAQEAEDSAGFDDGSVVREDAESEYVEEDDLDQISDLDRVFRFLNSEKRAGKCQTDDGIKIKQACRQACRFLDEHEMSLQEVSETSDNIRRMLTVVRRIENSEIRKVFKGDAYGHLFRHLTRFLEAVYDWAKQEYQGSEYFSHPSLQFIVLLIKGILSFKDTITSWRVEIPQRFKGDCLVKDVDQNLIAPLRKVEAQCCAKLRQLEEHKTREERAAKARQQREEQERIKAIRTLHNKRWSRWQALHRCRLKCEPDRTRRRRLFITRIDEPDELDSNGVRFDRVPIFGHRSKPPAHRASPSEEEEWTDDQMLALIDGLRTFAGPLVFESIFQKYCVPGGVLRDFTVKEITAQAALIRSSLSLRWQSKGWEVDKWIKQIPILR